MKFVLYLTLFFLALAFESCKKAENFYEELNDRPELTNLGYQSLYEVGDTLTMRGRLNPQNGLTIQIGNANAKIIEAGLDSNAATGGTNYFTDYVKMVITEDMGTGPNKAVTITSGKYKLNGSPIEIYSAKAAGYLSTELKLENYHTLPVGSSLLFCQNGKGTIFYKKLDNTIYKVDKNGTSSIVLQATDLKDVNGTFNITTFYSGGIDPIEKYLYFSALTTDASTENADNLIFRLCRFEFATKQVTTLNRTLFPKSETLPYLQAEQPLIGNISSVKLHAIGRIFPDAQGNVYLQPTALVTRTPTYRFIYATMLLNSSGSLSYIFKTSYLGSNYDNRYLPLYTKLPGKEISHPQGAIMDIENGLMYYHGVVPPGVIQTMQYDLLNGLQLSSFKGKELPAESDPYILGPFSNVTGDSFVNSSRPPDRFGFIPIGENKLMVLYYQGMDQTYIAEKFKKFPAWGVLDFGKKRGDRYAPGKLDAGTIRMWEDDAMLNYDEDGMLYMSANRKGILVKTKRK